MPLPQTILHVTKKLLTELKIRSVSDSEDDDYSAEALWALAELDTHGRDHIGFMLRFGEALAKAKRSLKHGHFKEWCGNILKRSPSWCSSHRRLFECRDDLEASLAWAKQTGHRWADCRSVEKLLKLVTEWKKATREDSAAAPRARRKAKEIIAELQQRLAEAEADFVALRDPIPAEVAARVRLSWWSP